MNARSPKRPIGNGAAKAMRVVLAQAGIAHGSLHAYQIGVPLEHSAAQLGHARTSTTEGYQSRNKAIQARAATDAYATEMLPRVRR